MKKIKTFLRKLIEQLIPAWWFQRKAYSQDGEDIVLMSFYETRKNHKGFYVDVGAHHPYRFSNTAIFYNEGWRGINIEPTPNLFTNFVKHRKRDINLNVGIANRQDKLFFYEFNEPAINTFNSDYAQRIQNEGNYKLVGQHEIRVAPLREILQQHLPPNQQIDFFTIDVEGLDLEVLQSNDWNLYKPTYILVEKFIPTTGSDTDEITAFLTELGYTPIARTKRTLIFGLNEPNS